MIEIKERNGFWEAYIDGALYEYNENLSDLLERLSKKADDIIDFMNE